MLNADFIFFPYSPLLVFHVLAFFGGAEGGIGGGEEFGDAGHGLSVFGKAYAD